MTGSHPILSVLRSIFSGKCGPSAAELTKLTLTPRNRIATLGAYR